MLPRASLFGLDVKGDRAFFYVIFICFVVLTWIAVNLIRTRFGRAFIAIRDNDRAAEGMGIPIFKYKLLSFAISSFYAGFAGGLAAYYIGSITPEPYTFSLSVEYIAMIIIGGLGSIPGAVFGSIFITLLNEILSQATQFFMNIEGLSQDCPDHRTPSGVRLWIGHRIIYYLRTQRISRGVAHHQVEL